MKSDHDRYDIIELPEFVNLPSDQGIVAGVEKAEERGPEKLEGAAPDVAAVAKADEEEEATETAKSQPTPDVRFFRKKMCPSSNMSSEHFFSVR